MAWTLLFIAGLCEVGWAIGLKYAEGFTKPVPSALTLVAMLGSVWLLGLAMRELPVGTAYAVWVGIGAVGTAVLGMWLFKEPHSALHIASLGAIVAGVAGLRIASGSVG